MKISWCFCYSWQSQPVILPYQHRFPRPLGSWSWRLPWIRYWGVLIRKRWFLWCWWLHYLICHCYWLYMAAIIVILLFPLATFVSLPCFLSNWSKLMAHLSFILDFGCAAFLPPIFLPKNPKHSWSPLETQSRSFDWQTHISDWIYRSSSLALLYPIVPTLSSCWCFSPLWRFESLAIFQATPFGTISQSAQDQKLLSFLSSHRLFKDWQSRDSKYSDYVLCYSNRKQLVILSWIDKTVISEASSLRSQTCRVLACLYHPTRTLLKIECKASRSLRK